MLVIIGLIAGLVLIIAFIVLVIYFIFSLTKPEDIIKKYQSASEEEKFLVKKYPEADTRSFFPTFLLVGFIFSIGLAIAAFSYTTYDRVATLDGDIFVPDEFEIEPPQTQQEPPPPPPPPPPQIEVIEDDIEIEEEPEIFDVEMDPDEEIEIPEIVEEEAPVEDEIFTIVEDMPEFPGGDPALMRYLANIPYPPIARENDIEGTVFVRFVVDRNGNVTDAEVVRGADRLLNDAALNHVKRMPAWTPGKQRGQPVRVQFTVPIRFVLN